VRPAGGIDRNQRQVRENADEGRATPAAAANTFQSMSHALDLPLIASGKVRDNYELDVGLGDHCRVDRER
jgi:hypothetical protein